MTSKVFSVGLFGPLVYVTFANRLIRHRFHALLSKWKYDNPKL